MRYSKYVRYYRCLCHYPLLALKVILTILDLIYLFLYPRFEEGRDVEARLQKVLTYQFEKSEYYGQVNGSFVNDVTRPGKRGLRVREMFLLLVSDQKS